MACLLESHDVICIFNDSTFKIKYVPIPVTRATETDLPSLQLPYTDIPLQHADVSPATGGT